MKKIIIGLILVVILFPLCINFIMFIPFSITTDYLHQQDWLSFWGNYGSGVIAGVGALFAVFFTIKYYQAQNNLTKRLAENAPTRMRIDEILNNISSRENIKSGLFYYDEKLSSVRDKIEKYNCMQGTLLSYFTNKGIDMFSHLYNFGIDKNGNDIFKNSCDKYYNTPKYIVDMGIRTGQLSLFENYFVLFRGDPLIGRYIDEEKGGSRGMWPGYWHSRELNEPEFIDELEEFFKLIPELTDSLQKIKTELS